MSLPSGTAVLARLRAELPAIRRWGMRGFWAVTDQALFAGTNFMVNVLLGRWLEPAEYGAFAVASSLLALAATVHGALWTEPMLVYGPGRLRDQLTSYLRVLRSEHWRFTIPAGLLCLLVGRWIVASFNPQLGWSIVGLGAAVPCVLYLLLVRQTSYVQLDARNAALRAGIYMVLCLGFIAIFKKTGHLGAGAVFAIMGFAAILVTAFSRLASCSDRTSPVTRKEVLTLHWCYGRWATVTAALVWVQSNTWGIILPAFHGFEAAAQYRALVNLVAPILQLNGVLGLAIIPAMVRAETEFKLRRGVRRALTVLVVLALVYLVVLLISGQSLLLLMYGERYQASFLSLALLGTVPVFAAVTRVYGSLLRAREEPGRLAACYGSSAMISVLLGVPLVDVFGVPGAFTAFAATAAWTALCISAWGAGQAGKIRPQQATTLDTGHNHL